MTEQIFPEPTVGVFVFNQHDKLLLLRSHKWPGKYVVPGGHVELGERLEEAVIRETDEAQEHVWVTLAEALHLPMDAYTRLCVEKLMERRGKAGQGTRSSPGQGIF